MDNIEQVIQKELKKAETGRKLFETQLKKLPKGVLRMKTIHGRKYGYLAQRVGKKVKYGYVGIVSDDVKIKYGQIKMKRAEYMDKLAVFKQRVRIAARLMVLQQKLAKKDRLKTFEEVNEILANHKAALRKRFRVRRIGVFGSYARREQRKNSDIDILVEYINEVTPGFEFFELESYLKRLLKIKKVDLATVGSLKEGMKDNILEEVRFI